MIAFPPAFFVTGTDTDVGKTFVSALLSVGLGAAYWKPVQAGMSPCTDREWLKRATALPDARFFPEKYLLSAPLSPHAAADSDGVTIELDKFCLPVFEPFPHLIVEGAGGIMVPLNDRHLMIDLIEHLRLPALLVTRSTLGTINHTLLSLSKLQERSIPLLGIVMNGPANPGNRRAIEKYGQVPVLAELEPLAQINRESLTETFKAHFEVEHARPDKDWQIPRLASVHPDANSAAAAESS